MEEKGPPMQLLCARGSHKRMQGHQKLLGLLDLVQGRLGKGRAHLAFATDYAERVSQFEHSQHFESAAALTTLERTQDHSLAMFG